MVTGTGNDFEFVLGLLGWLALGVALGTPIGLAILRLGRRERS